MFFLLFGAPTADVIGRELGIYPYLLLGRPAQQTQGHPANNPTRPDRQDKDLTPSSSFVTPDVQHHISVPKLKRPALHFSSPGSEHTQDPTPGLLVPTARAGPFTRDALPSSGDSPPST